MYEYGNLKMGTGYLQSPIPVGPKWLLIKIANTLLPSANLLAKQKLWHYEWDFVRQSSSEDTKVNSAIEGEEKGVITYIKDARIK